MWHTTFKRQKAVLFPGLEKPDAALMSFVKDDLPNAAAHAKRLELGQNNRKQTILHFQSNFM